MCVRVIERYALCGCLYHAHGVDACAAYGQHPISDKVVLIGYACPRHAEHDSSFAKHRDVEDNSATDLSSIFSASSFAASSTTSAPEPDTVDLFLNHLQEEEQLQYLWLQVALRSGNQSRCEELIETFLRSYTKALRKLASTPAEIKASKFVRVRRKYLATAITASCHTFLSGRMEGSTKVLDLIYRQKVDKDDGSDPEDIDESTIIYLKPLETFLFKSEAIAILQDDIKTFLRPHHSLPWGERFRNAIVLTIENWLSSITKHSIPNAATRIHWTCHCGRQLYDDYIEVQEERINGVTEFLNSYLLLRSQQGQHGSSPSSSSRAWWSPSTNHLTFWRSSEKDVNNAKLPTSSKDEDEQNPGVCKRRIRADNLGSNHNFVLCCVPFKHWTAKVHQAEVCTLNSDQDLFRVLRLLYITQRGPFRRMRLRKVKAIHFVEFDMYRNDLADIRVSPSLPPEDLQSDYSYHPMPADRMPPIGSNLLMHLYEHPDHADVLPTLFKKIPKKLRTKLEACPRKGSSVGWGVQFVEGLDLLMLFLVGVTGFVAVWWSPLDGL